MGKDLLSTLFVGAATLFVFLQSNEISGASQVTCAREKFRILIDVGHSEKEPGAISARGVGEYQFNLRIAREVVSALIGAGFQKTTLYIAPDSSRSQLVQRANAANTSPAQLFISIHHDSVPTQFYEKWTHEGVERNYSDRFRGHSIFVSKENPTFADSLLFGKLLGAEMKTRGFEYATQYKESFMGAYRRDLLDAETGVYRYDGLVVLKTTRVPAVLFEVGSIIHRQEEALQNDPVHRDKVVSAIVNAVEKFCTARPPR